MQVDGGGGFGSGFGGSFGGGSGSFGGDKKKGKGKKKTGKKKGGKSKDAPICHFFKQGKCRKGSSCNFRHETSSTSGFGSGHTSSFGSGTSGTSGAFGSASGTTSSFGGGAFGQDKSKEKKKECFRFKREGKCKFGDKCRFSHDISGVTTTGGMFGGDSTSSPFGTTPTGGGSVFAPPVAAGLTIENQFTPQYPFETVALDFTKYFFQLFCSPQRADITSSILPESVLTLNGTTIRGIDAIVAALMALGEASEPVVKRIDTLPWPVHPDAVLLLTYGTMKIAGGTYMFTMTFGLVKLEGGYFILNNIQRWG